jgi:hypothetical protein
LRKARHDVRFIGGALTNASSPSVSRTVTTYASNTWGSTATTLDYADIFGSRPPPRATEVVAVPSFGLIDTLDSVLSRNASAVIAVRLDVEGDELWILDQLAGSPRLCDLSFLFVEFHHLPGRRGNLTKYGVREDVYDRLKDRIHARMEQPGCRLQIYWRSFWSACGDAMRFQWQQSFQATDAEPAKAKHKSARGRSRRLRRQLE